MDASFLVVVRILSTIIGHLFNVWEGVEVHPTLHTYLRSKYIQALTILYTSLQSFNCTVVHTEYIKRNL